MTVGRFRPGYTTAYVLNDTSINTDGLTSDLVSLPVSRSKGNRQEHLTPESIIRLVMRPSFIRSAILSLGVKSDCIAISGESFVGPSRGLGRS